MRLIDADALASVLEEWEEKACDRTENDGSDGTTRVLQPVPTTTREMIDLIADQPTIEAETVKHGRWVDRYANKYANTLYECSECKGAALYKVGTNELGSDRIVQALTAVCPHCFAKMDKKVDTPTRDDLPPEARELYDRVMASLRGEEVCRNG